jgi:hypothetical protein
MVGPAQAADDFVLVEDMLVQRRRAMYPLDVVLAFEAVRTTEPTLAQPIRHAVPGEWQIFPVPRRREEIEHAGAVAVPGTARRERCVIMAAELWRVLVERSLCGSKPRDSPVGAIHRGGAAG